VSTISDSLGRSRRVFTKSQTSNSIVAGGYASYKQSTSLGQRCFFDKIQITFSYTQSFLLRANGGAAKAGYRPATEGQPARPDAKHARIVARRQRSRNVCLASSGSSQLWTRRALKKQKHSEPVCRDDTGTEAAHQPSASHENHRRTEIRLDGLVPQDDTEVDRRRPDWGRTQHSVPACTRVGVRPNNAVELNTAPTTFVNSLSRANTKLAFLEQRTATLV